MRSSLTVLGLLAVTAALLTGCLQAGDRGGDPDLPEGFGAALPDAPLGGYIHVSRNGEPFTVPKGLAAPDGTVVPIEGDVEALSIWLGPFDVNGFGVVAGRLRFPDAPSATAALAALTPDDEEGVALWARQRGEVLDFVLGESVAAFDIIVALTNDRYVSGIEGAPGAANTLQSFPSSPRRRPVAAGWVRFQPRLMPVALRTLAAQGWPDLRPVSSLLSQAGVKHVSFAVYGDVALDVIQPSEPVGAVAGGEADALFATDTTLAAPLLSITFNAAAKRLGLTPVRLPRGRGFAYEGDGLHTVARTRGGAVFASLSASEAAAIDLLDRTGS